MESESVLTHALQARRIAENRSTGESVTIAELPKGATVLQVLGVNYVHTITKQGGDLYLTTAGSAYAEHLQPENWHELEWFRAQRIRLEGTALVYALPTKPIRGENLGLVVKFSRVGERVPIDTQVIEDVLCCEFNGPFEEFALVEELRHSRRGSPDLQVHIQVPLAIYVPPETTQPSQSGRFQWRIARKVAQHPGISLDILREYIMVYGWIPGIDAWQAHTMGFLSDEEVRHLTERATSEVRTKGFSVLDMKPNHLIVQVAEPDKLVSKDGRVQYGLIDFELLERTTEYWQEVKTARRKAYQCRKQELLQEDGEVGGLDVSLPPNLHTTRILGVDYIHGRAESTGGMLWVVGRDPELFEYYLPERWRTTPQLRHLETHETYSTTTKDNIRFVWKVSRVGERPEVAASGIDGFRVLAQGFNSPFEEFEIAWWLLRRGISTIVPRAVYRTGHRSQLEESLFDPSRYQSHACLQTPDGDPILEERRNYITIWDDWNGPESADYEEDAPIFRSMNAEQAVERDLLTDQDAVELVEDFRSRLAREGVEVFRLVPAHILVAIGEDEALALDEQGKRWVCLCNFQYLRLPTLSDEAC